VIEADAFVARTPWPEAEVAALDGRCRGSLLEAWAAHVRRRWGDDGLAELRTIVGIPTIVLPDQPARDGWYRVAHQLALTRAIVDRFLGGDMAALEPLLREDAARVRDRWVDRVMRAAVGTKRILAASGKIHHALYDSGSVATSIDKSSAKISWRGARYFEEPTFGALQVFAVRGLFATMRERAPTIVAEPQASGLELRLTF